MVKLHPVCVRSDSLNYGITNRLLAKNFMPWLRWPLIGSLAGPVAAPFLHDIHQFVPLWYAQPFWFPAIKNQNVDSDNGTKLLVVCPSPWFFFKHLGCRVYIRTPSSKHFRCIHVMNTILLAFVRWYCLLEIRWKYKLMREANIFWLAFNPCKILTDCSNSWVSSDWNYRVRIDHSTYNSHSKCDAKVQPDFINLTIRPASWQTGEKTVWFGWTTPTHTISI